MKICYTPPASAVRRFASLNSKKSRHMTLYFTCGVRDIQDILANAHPDELGLDHQYGPFGRGIYLYTSSQEAFAFSTVHDPSAVYVLECRVLNRTDIFHFAPGLYDPTCSIESVTGIMPGTSSTVLRLTNASHILVIGVEKFAPCIPISFPESVYEVLADLRAQCKGQNEEVFTKVQHSFLSCGIPASDFSRGLLSACNVKVSDEQLMILESY